MFALLAVSSVHVETIAMVIANVIATLVLTVIAIAARAWGARQKSEARRAAADLIAIVADEAVAAREESVRAKKDPRIPDAGNWSPEAAVEMRTAAVIAVRDRAERELRMVTEGSTRTSPETAAGDAVEAAVERRRSSRAHPTMPPSTISEPTE